MPGAQQIHLLGEKSESRGYALRLIRELIQDAVEVPFSLHTLGFNERVLKALRSLAGRVNPDYGTAARAHNPSNFLNADGVGVLTF